ncbi:hypothetical protein BD769DRAFT_1397704 [Suillus cothurnatus]|nr:hypothetical protein BD769DRAFT_1397704 [Suillus cothurnatus]
MYTNLQVRSGAYCTGVSSNLLTVESLASNLLPGRESPPQNSLHLLLVMGSTYLVYQGKDLGRSSWLKKSVRSKQEEIISKGFSNLSLATLYQLFKSKLAGREAAHQHLVMTTWELEASERYTTFLDGLYRENKDRLLFSDEELKQIRNIFTDRSQEDIDNDVNYLQAVYDDDCEILCAVAAQANVLKKHLGSHASDDVLGSMGKSSHSPMDDGEGTDDDDDEEDDHAQPVLICNDTFNLGTHNSQRKGKTKIPKPTRGSGLNPSGLPVADQLNLPAEQPQMSAFDFNPYGQQLLYGDRESQGQPLYRDTQEHCQALYGDSQEHGQALYGDTQEHGQALYGDTQEHGQVLYGDSQEHSQALYGDAQEHGQALYGDTQEHGQALYGDTQEHGQALYGDSQEHGQALYGDTQEHGQDTLNDSGPIEYPSGPGPSVYPEPAAPVPRWIKDAPDEGISIIDRGNGLSPLASDLALIRQGEIPLSEVVHTTGPARTMTTRAVRHVNMPPTPYIVSRTPTIHTKTHSTVKQHETTSDAAGGASSSAMVSQNVIRLMPEKKKRRIIDDVIQESVLQFFGPNAVFQEFITSARHQVISNAISTRHRKMVEFTCEGVCDAFQLFPPQGHALPADQYRTARVGLFIHGDDPLMFMHDIFFDENGNMIIRAKFQSHFVMANVIQFVWYWGYASFLGKSPLKAIKYIVAVAGTATHCVLHEQGKHSLEIDPFGGQIHQSKFNEIIDVIDHLTPAEKAEFEQFLQYVLAIGPSQARDNTTSDSDSM